MKQKMWFLAFILTLAFFNSANAQVYQKAIGLRIGGFESGFTGKYFTDESTALEGIIGFGSGKFVLSGLYEKHAPAFDVPDLQWYFGVGAHIGGTDGGRVGYIGNNNKVYRNGILVGADVVLGLEYLLPELPVVVGADLRPRVELGRGPFLDLEPALSIRYVF